MLATLNQMFWLFIFAACPITTSESLATSGFICSCGRQCCARLDLSWNYPSLRKKLDFFPAFVVVVIQDFPWSHRVSFAGAAWEVAGDEGEWCQSGEQSSISRGWELVKRVSVLHSDSQTIMPFGLIFPWIILASPSFWLPDHLPSTLLPPNAFLRLCFQGN